MLRLDVGMGVKEREGSWMTPRFLVCSIEWMGDGWGKRERERGAVGRETCEFGCFCLTCELSAYYR